MKIDRMISIIMILLERQKASIPELAEICEVSPRTISRDLETINQAGIPIVSYPGLHGGVGIMENYKLEKRLFSTADVTTLLMGLGCIQSSLPGREVVNALAKVKGLIPEKQRREIELRAGRLVIDMTPWLGNSGCIETFQTIQQAMEQSRLLQFAYTDRQRQKADERWNLTVFYSRGCGGIWTDTHWSGKTFACLNSHGCKRLFYLTPGL